MTLARITLDVKARYRYLQQIFDNFNFLGQDVALDSLVETFGCPP